MWSYAVARSGKFDSRDIGVVSRFATAPAAESSGRIDRPDRAAGWSGRIERPDRACTTALKF
jgi:hypothetical protein